MDPLDPRPVPVPGDLEDRLLPWSQVRIIVGLSRTTVWRMQKSGDFPASVQISQNRIGWWQSELLAWKRARTPRRLPAPDVRAALATPRSQGCLKAQPVRTQGTPPPVATENRDSGPRRPTARRSRQAVAPGQAAFDF